MSHAQQMIGQTLGQLTVIRQAGEVVHGRNKVKVWLCQCSCDRKTLLEVDQTSLKKGLVAACNVCRRGPCVICGSPITDERYSVKRNTCSDACKKEQTKRRHRKRYQKLTDENPGHNKERYAERIQQDPGLNKRHYQAKQARIKKLPDDVQQVARQRAFDTSNDWRSRWREESKRNDPEAYRAFVLARRRAQHKHYQKKRMLDLMRSSQALSDKLKDSTDD